LRGLYGKEVRESSGTPAQIGRRQRDRDSYPSSRGSELSTIRLIDGQTSTILVGRWAVEIFLEGLTFFQSHVLPLPF